MCRSSKDYMKHYMKEYNARPAVKARNLAYSRTPDQRAKQHARRQKSFYNRTANNCVNRQRTRGHPEWAKPNPADIKTQWENQHGKCELCLCDIQQGQGSAAPGAAVLDAISPAHPYEPGNMVWLCAPCNIRKSDHTLETAQRLVEFLTENSYGIPRTIY